MVSSESSTEHEPIGLSEDGLFSNSCIETVYGIEPDAVEDGTVNGENETVVSRAEFVLMIR